MTPTTCDSESLRKAYEIVLSHTADFNYVFDLSGRFTFVNTALLDLWQKTLEEAVGRDFHDLDYPTELADRLQRQIQEVIDTGLPVRDETPYTSVTGTRAYEYIFTPVYGPDGKVEAVAGSTRDITHRILEAEDKERLMRELKGEQEKLLEIFQHSQSFMCVLRGPEHVFERVNERYYEIVGRREILGKCVYDALPEIRGQGFIELLDGVYQTGESYVGVGLPVLLQRTEGMPPEERFIDFVYQPLRDVDGCITGIFAQGVDLTDRIRAENELKCSEEKHRRLADALSLEDRRKNDFLALLAHELRNPLAPIQSGLEIMKLSGSESAPVMHVREVMARQLGHMVRLIDDLMDISRLSASKMELRVARVDLHEIIGSAVETARPVIESYDHAFTMGEASGAVFLNADTTRLAQVISNLLINSAKYTPRGGRIHLDTRVEEKEVIISVTDNGIGIQPESLETIFAMFSQVQRNEERSAGGLGIGLALVKGLVELHGGTVQVESAGLGCGSTFFVRLPLAAVETAAGEVDASAPDGPLKKRRILVVDDNHDAALSLRMLFEMMGHEAASAHDGEEAIVRSEEFRPDLIFMDVGMPKMGGYEATRLIRQQAWGKDIRIVALTGWGQTSDREESRAAGCDAHLVKPVMLADVEKLVEELFV